MLNEQLCGKREGKLVLDDSLSPKVKRQKIGCINEKRSLLELCKQEAWTYIEENHFMKQKKWKINEKDECCNTPIFICCRKGALSTLKILRSGIKRFRVNQRNIDDATLLLVACRSGNVELVKWLMEEGSDIHETDRYDNSSIIIATRDGHLDLVQFLVEQGCNVNHKNRSGETPFLIASSEGYLEIAQYLVGIGCSIRDKILTSGSSCIHLAAIGGHIKVFEWLISIGFDPSEVIDEKNSCVSITACEGHLELMKFLIEKGYSIHDRNNAGMTPLLLAAHYKRYDMVKLLIEHGGSIKDKNIAGRTCLTIISSYGNLELIQYLVDKGCSLQETTSIGSCIMIAALNKHIDCVIWMLNNGASLDENYILDFEGNIKIVKYSCRDILIQNGCMEKIKKFKTAKSSRK